MRQLRSDRHAAPPNYRGMNYERLELNNWRSMRACALHAYLLQAVNSNIKH